MGMDVTDLVEDLIRDEDLKLKPYRCTSGKLTIGAGRNIEDNGIRKSEAIFMLNNDISDVTKELDANVPWWRNIDPDAQRGLANMCFNLGWPRLSGFVGMLAALEHKQYYEAAEEALDSVWAMQVGERAERIAALFRSAK